MTVATALSLSSSACCPVCGAALAARPAGRRGRSSLWCGTPCRQTAWRARRAMTRAQAGAASVLARMVVARISYNAAVADLGRAYDGMLDSPSAATDPAAVFSPHGGTWERPLETASLAVQHTAAQLADLAREHHQHGVDYRMARSRFRHPDVLDLTDAPAALPVPAAREGLDDDAREQDGGGELPGQMAIAVPGRDGQDDVDRDDLFDAVDDLMTELQDGGLPEELSAAAADPIAVMAGLLETQAGDGPIGDLVDAARGLVDAVADYRRSPTTPPRLAEAADRLAEILTAV